MEFESEAGFSWRWKLYLPRSAGVVCTPSEEGVGQENRFWRVSVRM